jgi:hypothetical protein
MFISLIEQDIWITRSNELLKSYDIAQELSTSNIYCSYCRCTAENIFAFGNIPNLTLIDTCILDLLAVFMRKSGSWWMTYCYVFLDGLKRIVFNCKLPPFFGKSEPRQRPSDWDIFSSGWIQRKQASVVSFGLFWMVSWESNILCFSVDSVIVTTISVTYSSCLISSWFDATCAYHLDLDAYVSPFFMTLSLQATDWKATYTCGSLCRVSLTSDWKYVTVDSSRMKRSFCCEGTFSRFRCFPNASQSYKSTTSSIHFYLLPISLFLY